MTTSSSIKAALVGVQKVTALELLVADPRQEHERVIARFGCADLAHVREVLKHASDRRQDCAHGDCPLVGP